MRTLRLRRIAGCSLLSLLSSLSLGHAATPQYSPLQQSMMNGTNNFLLGSAAPPFSATPPFQAVSPNQTQIYQPGLNNNLTPGVTYNVGAGANPAIQTNSTDNITPTTSVPPLPMLDHNLTKIIGHTSSGASSKLSNSGTQTTAAGNVGQILKGHGVAIASNELFVFNKDVILQGVMTPGATAQCRTNQGLDWSCGEEGRQYLQTLLDQGQVVCVTVTRGVVPGAICRVGFDDLAAGMNTWPALIGLQAKAQSNR